MSSLFHVSLHPHIENREAVGAPKVSDGLASSGTDSGIARFNNVLATRITKGVGTMRVAYAFAALSLVSLPGAIMTHSVVVLVSWISQTFLQLTLLAVLQLGQNLLAQAADKRAEATYNDATAILATTVDIQKHLEVQDDVITQMHGWIQRQPTGPASSS
jgi:hypothetical protein